MIATIGVRSSEFVTHIEGKQDHTDNILTTDTCFRSICVTNEQKHMTDPNPRIMIRKASKHITLCSFTKT